ncbi:DUF4126 domain-containing protein [Nodosilinea nodulosa]|uniref:DUF4126 domain-containing protein n=1 Tax=Nodosilinea nodulosa TaxID=416001 RepID=UPI000314ADD6|nr:DUF4126 domain-containing protein [Nodosilinea nodulosa]
MDVLLQIAIGIGLSAAAGFRILVPFLIAGIAAQQGYLTLSPGLAWMGTTPAILAFTAATVLEVLVYFVPVVDNLMDAVELPAAAIAGTVLTLAVTGDMNPFLQWSLALIAGGGVASSTQAFTGLTRLASTAAAGPVGNIAVSTTELASSTILSVLAIAVPILVLIVVGVLLYLVFRRRGRKRRVY